MASIERRGAAFRIKVSVSPLTQARTWAGWMAPMGIDRELNPLSDMPEIHQELSRLLSPRHEPELHPEMEHGPDLGIDIGL
jgi:hypothetical protein